MEKDKKITEVIFRKFPDGDIIAIFPYQIEGFGVVMCYQHIGQHGTCDLQEMIYNQTKLAKPEEYDDLKKELENHYGYNLKVMKKVNHKKINWYSTF